MASLINCQPVTSWTAEEYEGDQPNVISGNDGSLVQQGQVDGVVNSSGLLQDGPAGSGNEAYSAYYYLVIKPMPGYHITRDMITIENISIPEISFSYAPVIYANNPEGVYNETFTNGILTYTIWNDGGSDTGIVSIKVYDNKMTEYNSCDNWVILEIYMMPLWEMPGNNHTIKLDLGGEAVECIPPQIIDEISYDALLFVTDITTNDYQTNTGFGSLFMAQYYDDESYASSPYNMFNSGSYLLGNPGLDELKPPVYDWTGDWTEDNPDYNNSCWDGYQPTCYTLYATLLTGDSDNPWFGDENDYISTTCGQLLVSPVNIQMNGFALWAYTFQDQIQINVLGDNGPDYPANTTYSPNPNRALYYFKVSSDSTNFRYLSEIDYPNIEPGGPVIPSSLSWYISVGNESDYELEAEFIDVWKIVTVIGQQTYLGNLAQSTPVGCDTDSTPITWGNYTVAQSHLVSDSTENNSDLDLASKTITNIDSKTVKLTIPFKSDLSISRFTNENELAPNNLKRQNKIFLNINPILP